MAVLALTATADVLGALPGNVDFTLDLLLGTTKDNGDGTWSVTAETQEENIAALQGLGCTVVTVVSDADQVAAWQILDTQIDNEPPVA